MAQKARKSLPKARAEYPMMPAPGCAINPTMRYPPAVLESIKARLNLVDEVRRTIPDLKKKGRYFWGRCPFHNEKSASFHVREEGNYYCFGCGAGGDIFSFVQETQGGTFTEVVQQLARRAGVSLPEPERTDPAAAQKKQDAMAALNRAVVFFQRNLQGSPGAGYLERRGLSAATIEEFALGYAPDSWNDLRDALLGEGFDPAILRQVGLTVESDKGRGDYDRFRGRVMFPIHNGQGNPVGFGGRILDKGEPKYLNSPDTPYFSKSHLLFNLHRARPHLRTTPLVLVEGYMDAVSLWQAGLKTAVAPMGTAVTEDQLGLIWQSSREHTPVVCLDGDAAGRTAALRAAERALPVLEPGRTLGFVFLPQGEDPDSLVQKDGLAAFHQLLAQPVPLEQIVWQKLVEGTDLATADGRAAVEAELARVLGSIRNATVRKAYQQVFREKMYLATRGGRSPGKGKTPGGKMAEAMQAPQDYRPALGAAPPARTLLALVCRWPDLLNSHAEELGTVTLADHQLADVRNHLLRAHMVHGSSGEEMVADLLAGPLGGIVLELLRTTGVETLPQETDPEALFDEVYQGLRQQGAHKQRHTELLKRMKTGDLTPEMWQELQHLIKKDADSL